MHDFFLNLLRYNCSKPHWRKLTFFVFLLCSDLTSHISVGMKIRFKDRSVPDNSDKVWYAKLCMAAINICNFFFFCLKATCCLSGSKEILAYGISYPFCNVHALWTPAVLGTCQLLEGFLSLGYLIMQGLTTTFMALWVDFLRFPLLTIWHPLKAHMNGL